jgi:hypothetical protein
MTPRARRPPGDFRPVPNTVTGAVRRLARSGDVAIPPPTRGRATPGPPRSGPPHRDSRSFFSAPLFFSFLLSLFFPLFPLISPHFFSPYLFLIISGRGNKRRIMSSDGGGRSAAALGRIERIDPGRRRNRDVPRPRKLLRHLDLRVYEAGNRPEGGVPTAHAKKPHPPCKAAMATMKSILTPCKKWKQNKRIFVAHTTQSILTPCKKKNQPIMIRCRMTRGCVLAPSGFFWRRGREPTE